jgi:hypothetical protein
VNILSVLDEACSEDRRIAVSPPAVTFQHAVDLGNTIILEDAGTSIRDLEI